MSKALQVYDKLEGKVVDIPEDEVESVPVSYTHLTLPTILLV